MTSLNCMCAKKKLQGPCRPPPGLIGSQFLDESQMPWSSACTGAKACHARTPTKVFKVCPVDSSSGTSSRRQATVESDSLSGICGSVPDAEAGVLSEKSGSVKESRAAGTRSSASQGQAAGKEQDSDENVPLAVPRSARVVSGRQHHRLRMLVDHLVYRGGRSEESLVERKAVRTLPARRNHQTALGTFLKFVKERALPLVEDVEIHRALVAYSDDCIDHGVQRHHGSQLLAAVMDRWPSFSRIGSRRLPRFHRCFTR